MSDRGPGLPSAFPGGGWQASDPRQPPARPLSLGRCLGASRAPSALVPSPFPSSAGPALRGSVSPRPGASCSELRTDAWLERAAVREQQVQHRRCAQGADLRHEAHLSWELATGTAQPSHPKAAGSRVEVPLLCRLPAQT